MAVGAFAADGFVGARTCRTCHAAQFERQAASGHARTLQRAADFSLPAPLAGFSALRNGFEFSTGNQGGAPYFRIHDPRAASAGLDIPLHWTFGSGTHGVTFVSRLSPGTYLEHAFSYYAGPKRFDLTPGHRRLPSRTAAEAAGQTFRIGGSGGGAVIRCFQCHSTGPASVSASRQEILVTEQGVRCEVCHGAGERHVRAAAARNSGQIRSTIRNPGTLPASEVLNLCGTCHRPVDGRDAPNDFADPWNVRHQPPYLQQSKCFQASADRLSCFRCHPPHEPLRRSDPGYYRQQCLGCHESAGGKAPSTVCLAADPRPDCTACHMPAVAPDPNLRFRNHWIGVYRAGAPLVPSR